MRKPSLFDLSLIVNFFDNLFLTRDYVYIPIWMMFGEDLCRVCAEFIAPLAQPEMPSIDKLYENKGIEAEKSWVSSEVQIWNLMKRRKKKIGLGRSTDLKSYENETIEAEKS